jgi:hypothetical protein
MSHALGIRSVAALNTPTRIRDEWVVESTKLASPSQPPEIFESPDSPPSFLVLSTYISEHYSLLESLLHTNPLGVAAIRLTVRRLSDCLHRVVVFYADIPRTRSVQHRLRDLSQSLQLADHLSKFIESSLALLFSLEQFTIHCEFLLGGRDPADEPVHSFLLDFMIEFGACANTFLEHFEAVCPTAAFDHIIRELREQTFVRDAARPSRLPRIAGIRRMLAELRTATDLARVEELVVLITLLRGDVDRVVRDVFARRVDDAFRKRYDDAWNLKFVGGTLARVAKEFAAVIDEAMEMAEKQAEVEEAKTIAQEIEEAPVEPEEQEAEQDQTGPPKRAGRTNRRASIKLARTMPSRAQESVSPLLKPSVSSAEGKSSPRRRGK